MRVFSVRSLSLCSGVVLVCGALTGCPQPRTSETPKVGSQASGGNLINLVDKKAEQSGAPIATMDGFVLTTGEIESRLNSQSPFVRSRFSDPEERLKFVEQQVRVEVLAKEAMALNYHAEADVQDALKKIIVQKLTRQKFDSAVRPDEITDAELAAYYESHIDEYNKAEMVRLAQIFIPFGSDDAAKEKARAEATKVAAEAKKKDLLNDRKHFKDLVAKYSQDEESKKVGGDLRYLTKKQMQEKYGDAVANAAFTMVEINDVAGPLEGKTGFHIIKRTGQRKEIVRTLEQVKNPIRNVLYREKRSENFDKYVEELKAKYHVTIDATKIDQIKLAKEPARSNIPLDPHGAVEDDGHGH